MKRKALDRKNLPCSLPTSSTAIAWLLLDRFSAPGWLWGVSLTLLAILWIASIYDVFTCEKVELQ